MKNFLITLLVSLVKRWRGAPKTQENRRFLIVSTTGLGDTLWATPAIKALKNTYPDAYLAVLTSPIGFEILAHNPYLDDLFVVKKPTFFSLISLFFPLRKKKIDTAFIFHASQRTVLPFCSLIGASTLIGNKGMNKGLDHLLSRALEPSYIHEMERRLKLVGISEANPYLEMHLTPLDHAGCAQFLEPFHIPSYIPLVGIHPGAKDPFKQWNPHHFIEVARGLKEHLGCQIFITGNREEKDLVLKIASQVEGSIPITGELALRPFSALIQRMSLMITNDTGPMHIAFAVGTPTVALFCPTDPKLCGPHLAPRVKVIQKPRTCSPCLRKKCQEPFCLLQISPKEVYESAIKLFYKGSSYVI